MKFKAADWDLYYTEYEDDTEHFDFVAFSKKHGECYTDDEADSSYLSGLDDYGNPYQASKLSEDAFEVLKSYFMEKSHEGGAIVGFPSGYTCVRRRLKDPIPADTVRKAIRGELSLEELNGLINTEKEPTYGDYYDFGAFERMIRKFMNGEISARYYQTWLILVSRALQNNSYRSESKKQRICWDLSSIFDGHSFDKLDSACKMQNCRDMLCDLRFADHKIRHTSQKKLPPFYNEGNVLVYLQFSHCNGSNEFYNVCIANESDGIFRIAYISNPRLSENVNYTFLDHYEFWELTNQYYEYVEDPSLDIGKYFFSINE